jgi:hypothetical protein
MPTVRLIPGWAACALAVSLLAPSAATPAPAAITPGEMAAIEATAPLDDASPSDEAVKAAIAAAFQKAARGAIAMGLPWLHIQAAYVRPGYVGVQVLATARPSDDEGDARPDHSERTPSDSDSGADRDADGSIYRIRL